MNYLLEVALSNAIVVTGLAAVVFLVTRIVRNPALCHGLWVLVLVKLLTPPLVHVPLPASWGLVRQSAEVVPEMDAGPSILPLEANGLEGEPGSLADVSFLPGEGTGQVAEVAKRTSAGGVSRGDGFVPEPWIADAIYRCSIVVWLIGTALVALTTGVRVFRLRGLLRLTESGPIDLQEEVRVLAARVGVRPCPDVCLLPTSVGPAVWAMWGKPKILFPAELFVELGDEARRTILLHELCHLRRRDHWVRILELVVTALFWWHPVVWWVRREIRPLEEACCDSFVVSEMPESRRTYATALVQSLRLLGRPSPAMPPAMSGIASYASIRRRVTLIMIGSHRKWLSGPGRFVLVLAAVVCLPLFPALSQGSRTSLEGQVTFAPAEAVRLYDGFDGEYALDWNVVRPDPTHVSLSKNPGRLTITTQRGTIYRRQGPLAKNLYLIRNPLVDGSDFVLTTCIDSFAPTMAHQQAGLVVYDDDDNYLKCDVDFGGSSVRLTCVRETDGEPINDVDRSGVEWERIWIRIIKRGNIYERAYSTDGKEFVSAGRGHWGDGSPKRIGIFAKYALSKTDEIDARFDYFEFRSLSSAESANGVLPAPDELDGTWGLVSLKRDGQVVENLPYMRLVFDGRELVAYEGTKLTRMECVVDATQPLKVLRTSGFLGTHSGPVAAAYRVDGEKLVVCYDPRPGAEAPGELETSPGDGRLLFTLKRMPADMRFKMADVDKDGHVSLEEFTEEYWYLVRSERVAGVFAAMDRDGDGKLKSWEMIHKSQETLFLLKDYNADRRLSVAEFTSGIRGQDRIAAAKEEFCRRDEDKDGLLSFREATYRFEDFDFWESDQDGDCALNFDEFLVAQPSRSMDESRSRFQLIDRNGDGVVGLAEFQTRFLAGKSA